MPANSWKQSNCSSGIWEHVEFLVLELRFLTSGGGPSIGPARLDGEMALQLTLPPVMSVSVALAAVLALSGV